VKSKIMNKQFINPVKGKVTSKYGDRIHPVTKAKKFHNGVDIGIPIGTTIVSPANGKVILADTLDDDAGGLQLKIQHDGFVTGYAHLSKILVKVGDIVKQGDIVCKSGNSGAGTGAHLHFTLRKGTNPSGTTIDPLTMFDFK